MWNNATLKKKSKHSLKKNYWKIIAVCVLVTFISGGFGSLTSSSQTHPVSISATENVTQSKTVQGNRFDNKSNSQIVDEFIRAIEEKPAEPDEGKTPYTRGVLSNFANSINGAGSFLFGTLNALNQMMFQDRIGAGFIIAIGSLLSLLYWFLISGVILIGQCRFFLETRIYDETEIGRILFPYRLRRGFHAAWVMFVKNLYLFFWFFTIIGLPIKAYAYKMIPYILAENPSISRKEAMNLSRVMMKGNKWKAFCLDLSFLGWHLLSALTFNLLNVLFVNPYKLGTTAELYMVLREKAREKNLPNADLLCDAQLDVPACSGEYPDELYFIKMPDTRSWLRVDYRREYSLVNLILIFFVFAFVGWLWEVCAAQADVGALRHRRIHYLLVSRVFQRHEVVGLHRLFHEHQRQDLPGRAVSLWTGWLRCNLHRGASDG